MYKAIARPLLFVFPPEAIHHIVFGVLSLFFKVPGKKWFVKNCFDLNSVALERNLFGLTFKNPVGIAAGFDKQAALYNHLPDFGFGFVEIGTITPLPQRGNPKPRLFRLPKDKALINRMGFNNIGVEKAVEKLSRRTTKAIVGGNIGKNTATPNHKAVDDYIFCFEKLFGYVDYFVVNVSCPNITDLRELQDQESLTEILVRLQQLNNARPHRKPILLKVSPDLNQQQLDEVIEIVKATAIDGVVATNTTITRSNLLTSKEKVAQIGNGGLSGRPLKDRSTEVIRYLAEKSGKAFPIIGAGGIFTPEDAIEKMDAGADLVQVYTGFIYEGPSIAKKINKKILSMKRLNVS